MLMQGFVALSNANVLAGTLFEFITRPSRVSVAVVSDVAINSGNTWTLQIADRVIVPNGAGTVQPPQINSATSVIVGVVYPDSYHVQNEPGFPGNRLVLAIVRAAGNIMWSVQIIEVA